MTTANEFIPLLEIDKTRNMENKLQVYMDYDTEYICTLGNIIIYFNNYMTVKSTSSMEEDW
jgi:hypothetical protein